MAQIKGPVLPNIDPNRWLECERALEERFTEIATGEKPSTLSFAELIDDAIEAGWTEPEVKRALLDLMEDRYDPDEDSA
ncbi:hypothetical protein [Phyllobacterium bourgognense]|uniref:Uncharacterized protein n=1 Tax=Phyllobacterium bourgognense TaxID=314236 RepID=A0A368YBX3_9HYPH|nr:hypothetical protein [Phyllobacterium bourgognense]RCW77751.1 hypothetical protein C7476_13816 [Phyllobacterium bourgognense]